MKILHIGISEHLGGIETYLYKIASNIDLTEYQFDFLTYPEVTPCFYDELTAMGCQFQRVTPRRENIIKFRNEFDALLKRENYDIVHCHMNTLSFTEPIDIALKNEIKVIVHSRNGQFIGGKRSEWLHNLHYRTLKKDKIKMVAVSDIAGKWMFGEGADFSVLNNGVDLDRFHYLPEGRDAIREEFGIEDERLIIHTGAFRTQKNHEFLIDIFSKLHELEPDTKLMLVGNGTLLDGIKNKVSVLGLDRHVIFTGRRVDVPELLSAGDIFLFPSLYEGFPNSLIEAEATGLICIASDTITEQAKIPSLCEYVGLDQSAEKWAKVIHEKRLDIDRASCANKVREAGLDVWSEIKRMTDLYLELAVE